MKDSKTTQEAIITVIAGLIAIYIIVPFLVFWLGYLGGIFIKWTLGSTLIKGLALLNLSVSIENVPLFFGTIGLIGSYFKTTVSNK